MCDQWLGIDDDDEGSIGDGYVEVPCQIEGEHGWHGPHKWEDEYDIVVWYAKKRLNTATPTGIVIQGEVISDGPTEALQLSSGKSGG